VSRNAAISAVAREVLQALSAWDRTGEHVQENLRNVRNVRNVQEKAA
jgi:hypothetical protein